MTRGFTLAEMVVVLAILGITAAAVVPAFTRLAPEDELTNAAAQLDAVLASARQAALERAAAVQVTLIPASGRYWLRFDDGTPLDSGVIELAASVTLHSRVPRPRVRFSRLGIVDADSVMMVGPNGARALTVNRWTGEAYVARR